jgi:hypothetical protein
MNLPHKCTMCGNTFCPIIHVSGSSFRVPNKMASSNVSNILTPIKTKIITYEDLNTTH